MTPAKALALMGKRLDDLEIRDLPWALAQWRYFNAHREEKAKEIPLERFKTFSRKDGNKAQGKYGPGGVHNLKGARANRAEFEAWARGKSKNRIVVKKVNKEK